MPAPVVRVMVEHERRQLQIEGFDLVVSDAVQGKEIAHLDREASLSLSCRLSGKLEIHNKGKKKNARFSGPFRVRSLGGFIRIHGRQYRDDLYVYALDGECVAVNHVDIEKYIAGLLNSEMSASWNMEALKAQAVAARTYALYQMRQGANTIASAMKSPFDLESTVRDQVYEGAHKERYRALRAVQETRGQILAYHGQPIKAFYHSTCGGETESAERVWGVKLPYLRPVKCGYCQNSPRFQWMYEIPHADLENKLQAAKLLAGVGSLKGVRILERNRMGRAAVVELLGTAGLRRIRGTQLRDALGSVHLRSTDFRVVASPAAKSGWVYTFHGIGSGHGVGMCQYGAKAQGEAGRTYAQILGHYYPAADLSKIY